MSRVKGRLETKSQSVGLNVFGITIIPHRWSMRTEGIMHGGGLEASLVQVVGNNVKQRPELERTGKTIFGFERLGTGEFTQASFVRDGSGESSVTVGITIPSETLGGGVQLLVKQDKMGPEIDGIAKLSDQTTHDVHLNLADQNLAGNIVLRII